ALVVLVRFGPRIARAWELGRVATGVMVGAVTTLAVWAVALPFGFIALWWGRRYGIEKESYGVWLFEQWPTLVGQVVGLTILLTILLVLAVRFRRPGWLVAWPILPLISFVPVLVLPYAATPWRR